MSAIAGILLKSLDFHFFQYCSCRDAEKFGYFVSIKRASSFYAFVRRVFEISERVLIFRKPGS